MDVNYVVITGATKGLGKALTEQFREHGIKVVGCARHVDHQQLNDDDNLLLSAVDMVSAAESRQWAETIMATHGVPDMVIQSAGTINTPGNIEALDVQAIRQVLDINIMGIVNGMRAFIPEMKQVNRGLIVNLSSGWGREGKEGLAPYCASKFAVEGLSDAVAREQSGAVRIYALDPGDGVQTEMLQTCLPDYYPHAPEADNWAACAFRFLNRLWVNPNDTVSQTVDLSGIQAAT